MQQIEILLRRLQIVPQINVSQSFPDLEPLTHRNKHGEIIQRPSDVDEVIHISLLHSSEELVEVAKIEDKTDVRFISEEALVYLTCLNFRTGNKEITDELISILIKRCTRFLQNRFCSLPENEANEAYEKAIEVLFDTILFREDGRGDFFQVKFWAGLKRISIDVFRHFVREIRKMRKSIVSLSEFTGDDFNEDEEYPEFPVSKSISYTEITDPEPSVEKITFEPDEIKDLLKVLTEPIRTAYILYHGYDWQIESVDPTEPTLSKHFRKTPRTIRNWLYKAQEILINNQGVDHE